MRTVALALALCLAACGQEPASPVATGGSDGAALEQAAIARGIVADPASIDPIGAFASDSDHVCVVPDGARYRLGASVDYGEGQSCIARGTATGRVALDVRFGGGCRFTARIEGERMTFPADIPDACESLCRGRASLQALSADRLSTSATEAVGLAAPDGKPLCP